jgi:hypothetical protein
MAKPSGEIIIFVVAILTTSSSDPSRAAEPCARELAALTHDGVIKGDIDSKGGAIVAGHKFGGGMTILCAGDQITNPDVTIGVNAREPGDAFMLYFGDLAHRVTGVSSREAVKFARQCYNSAIRRAGNDRDSLYSGEQVDIKNQIHIDCRVGKNFTSLGVFNRRGLDDE